MPTAADGQQLQSVYDVVAAATGQHGVYNVPGGQQPVAVPYHPAEYGFLQQQQRQQPPPSPSRYQEPRRPPPPSPRPQPATTPEPPNRKRPAQHASPAPQQQQQQHPAPVQYTRVQNDVAGGTSLMFLFPLVQPRERTGFSSGWQKGLKFKCFKTRKLLTTTLGLDASTFGWEF